MTRPDHRCRFCDAILQQTLVDLGRTPLANSYLTADDLKRREMTYPLHAMVCSVCMLVQIEAVATPEEIFGDYAYFSSYSTTWLEHSERFAVAATNRFSLGSRSLVLEVASNDGYLLRYFRGLGVEVFGVEPADNVAKVAREHGIPTESEFFGVAYASQLVERGIRPNLLIGNNVLAHVPDINDFVAGLALVLESSGVLSMEFPHLLELMAGVQFDTIYHEHFSYLSLLAVESIFLAHGLRVFDVEQIPTHGGSLRVYASLLDSPVDLSANVERVRSLEISAGLGQIDAYSQFAARVDLVKESFAAFLESARAQGLSVAGYGAAAKGNTLLNTCGIEGSLIDFVVDKSPHKQGLYLPGSHLPIFAPEHVNAAKPDFLVILPWNIKDEILGEMERVRDWGCRFVVAIPELQVID
jgi:SAM-dependent methyltransferase